MLNRAAILFDDGDDGHDAFLGTLSQVRQLTEVRGTTARPGHGAAPGSMRRAWWLATYRPHLVIASVKGPDALLAALYRLLFPRSRLLVRLCGPSGHGSLRDGLLRSIVLSRADAVLTESDTSRAALPTRWTAASGTEQRIFPLSGPADLEPFLACPLIRAPGSIHRIACVGPLSPGSAASDILLCVAAWARQNADHPVEIWWIGDGDLVGILDAQPLPARMSQRFLGPLDRSDLAGCFAQCGILVVGTEEEGAAGAPVAEALAAGLVVVGSRSNVQVRRLVQDGVTGWSFDPARFEEFALAIARALGGVSDRLATMRAEGRKRMMDMMAQTDADRLHAAVSTLLPAARPGSPQASKAASWLNGLTAPRRGAGNNRVPGVR